jgi:F420-dependent methylenetetrahydromethanopterin dehydrogenase
MTIHYSAITNGFYRDGDKLPTDVIEITQQQLDDLMHQQEQGFVIVPNHDGYPTTVENIVDPIEAAIANKTQMRIMADDEISWLQDAVDVGIATDEETAALAAWKKYRVLLMRVDTAAPVWPTPPEGQAS